MKTLTERLESSGKHLFEKFQDEHPAVKAINQTVNDKTKIMMERLI